jgi:hypothetical protein
MRDLSDGLRERVAGENLPELRICAICLMETPRATYEQHMTAHGYTTLNVQQLADSE